MKLAILITTGISVLALAYAWYIGEQTPAWLTMLWCASVFLSDLEKYLENK